MSDEMRFRCPVCLLGGKDPVLRYDHRKARFYCQTCCFTGQPADIRKYYGVFQSKYRQISQRVSLKRI